MAYTDKRGSTWTGYYRDASGRKYTKGGFSRKRDAAEWATLQEQSVKQGSHVLPRAGRVTFATWADRWQASLSVGPRTRDTYAERLASLILPRWKDVPLDRITLTDVKTWTVTMESRSGQLAGDMRRRNAAQLFIRMLDAAVDEDLLPRNPAHTRSGRKTDYLPRATTVKPHRYLTHEQLGRLADAAPAEARRLILLTGYTGMRFGEVSALRVADVNPLNGQIQIMRAYTQLDNGQIVLGGTKSRKTRTVVVPPSLRHLMAESIAGKVTYDLVFPSTNGHPLRRDNFTARAFHAAVEASRTAVATVQEALGLPQPERSGVYDPATDRRVRAFQTANEVPASGLVDRATWAALIVATEGKGTRWTSRLAQLSAVTLGPGCEDFARLTFHDLRHTAASLAIAAGADVKGVQSMLGHASAAMTLDVYAGLFPGSLEAVAERLDEQLSEASAHILPTFGGVRSLKVAAASSGYAS